MNVLKKKTIREKFKWDITQARISIQIKKPINQHTISHFNVTKKFHDSALTPFNSPQCQHAILDYLTCYSVNCDLGLTS